jgi:hypothetical protein
MQLQQFSSSCTVPARMRCTHEKMEQRLPCLLILRLHARLRMPHATTAPTRRARTHACAHHMAVDAHVGGNRTTCPLRLTCTWGPLHPRGPHLHVPASYTC